MNGAGSLTGLVVYLVSSYTKASTYVGPSSSSGIKVKRDGQLHTGASGTSATVPYSDEGGMQWCQEEATDIGDGFECRFDTSDTLDVGTKNTWLAVTSDRAFELNGGVFHTAIGTLRIRPRNQSGAGERAASVNLSCGSVK